jgi:hypothetical protein
MLVNSNWGASGTGRQSPKSRLYMGCCNRDFLGLVLSGRKSVSFCIVVLHQILDTVCMTDGFLTSIIAIFLPYIFCSMFSQCIPRGQEAELAGFL